MVEHSAPSNSEKQRDFLRTAIFHKALGCGFESHRCYLLLFPSAFYVLFSSISRIWFPVGFWAVLSGGDGDGAFGLNFAVWLAGRAETCKLGLFLGFSGFRSCFTCVGKGCDRFSGSRKGERDHFWALLGLLLCRSEGGKGQRGRRRG